MSTDTMPARKYLAVRLGTLDFNDYVHVSFNGDTLPARKHLAMSLGAFAMLNAGSGFEVPRSRSCCAHDAGYLEAVS